MKIILTLLMISLSPMLAQCQTANAVPEVQIANVIHSGGYSGTTDKQLSRMGDAAAVVVTKILGESNLGPRDIENILIVIHLSFSAPLIVEGPGDRSPRTTLFLLQSFNSVTTDQKLRRRIAEERKFVLDQFAKSKDEAH